MAGIRDLLGKYGITQHAEGAKKRKSKKAEECEPQQLVD